MQSEQVIHWIKWTVSENLLSEKNQCINNYQVLYNRGNRLKAIHSNICHPGEFRFEDRDVSKIRHNLNDYFNLNWTTFSI